MASKSDHLEKPCVKQTLKRKPPDDPKLKEPPRKSPYFAENESASPPAAPSSVSPSEQTGCQNMTSLPARLGRSFYDKPCIELAKQLLGKSFVRVIDGERVIGRIVETEAYVGAEDTACKTYKGRKTASNKSMFLSPGHAYIYMTYGMYHCINITSNGEGQAVLLRALSPTEGAKTMRTLRQKASKTPDKVFKERDLCNGPGKLCLSLNMDRTLDGTDLIEKNSPLWIETGDPISSDSIVSCPRIGIDSATKEWVEKPLRFYVRGEPCVSKRNKNAEAEMNSIQ